MELKSSPPFQSESGQSQRTCARVVGRWRKEKRIKSGGGSQPDIQYLLAWVEIGKGAELAKAAREKGNDEVLLRKAMAKFEQALVLKPDKHEALSNWGNALSALYHKTKDSNLLGVLEAKCRATEAIEGKANYNLACALALQGRSEETEAQLLRCKADGTLPSAEHLAADKDLEAYWDRDWFKELVG